MGVPFFKLVAFYWRRGALQGAFCGVLLFYVQAFVKNLWHGAMRLFFAAESPYILRYWDGARETAVSLLWLSSSACRRNRTSVVV